MCIENLKIRKYVNFYLGSDVPEEKIELLRESQRHRQYVLFEYDGFSANLLVERLGNVRGPYFVGAWLDGDARLTLKCEWTTTEKDNE